MAEEPVVRIPTEEPRRCPECGSRVAALATSCLMCGCSLEEQEEAAPEEPPQRRLPGWVRGLAVVGIALAILAAGGFGFYRMMTAQPEPVTPTATPSPTPTHTPTPTPSPTPTITPTPTPMPPRSHQVQPDETLIEIAENYGITTDAILSLNPDLDPELLQVGQVLLIPPDPAAVPADGEPSPSSGDYIIHIVQPGEALLSIAEEYEVSVESIRLANDMGPYEDRIQVNQSLVIPVSTPTPTPLPTRDPQATATPLPPYGPPHLLVPADGAIFVAGDRPVILQWTAVGLLAADEWYAVRLVQRGGGTQPATHYTRSTSWRVPIEVLRGADAETREFRWHVQVVHEATSGDGIPTYEKAGSASDVRTFTWFEPTPTPSPPATGSQ